MVTTYSDPLTETSQHPLPTACKFCGSEPATTVATRKNPGVLFRCGTLWLPVSAYSKRTEPEWQRYEALQASP